MALLPPVLVQQAMMASTSRIVRRCAIYNTDGNTIWTAGGEKSRLIEGNVSVDYSRDERRSLDCTLDNSDGLLKHDPNGFWYDKVLKVYYGVEYWDKTLVPVVTVRTNLCTNPSAVIDIANWGGVGVDSATMTSLSDITAPSGTGKACRRVSTSGTSIGISSNTGLIAVGKYAASFWIRSSKVNNFSLFFGGTATKVPYSASPVVLLANVWKQISFIFDVTVAGTVNIGGYCSSGAAIGDILDMTGALCESGSTIKPYFDGSVADTSNRVFSWTGVANASTSTLTVTNISESSVNKLWETQIGEFVIDRLDTQNFPSSIKVTARDYTKKCMLSKFTTATGFTTGVTIESVIKAIAQNAGITKFLLPVTGKVTGKEFFFERGTERWAAMKEIAKAYSFDIYFDGQGYLVLSAFKDPVSAPLSHVLLTGPEGNLVSFTKSVNDSRLYNHIIVTGESSDTAVAPVSAEATNTEPSSPSRISRIGDRVYQYTSSFITTVLQAQEVADNFLKVHALEEYDVNFSAIMAPWLEVGEIVEFHDPDAGPTDPIRYLLSSLGIPLGLSPMSGNAKRVGIVK